MLGDGPSACRRAFDGIGRGPEAESLDLDAPVTDKRAEDKSIRDRGRGEDFERGQEGPKLLCAAALDDGRDTISRDGDEDKRKTEQQDEGDFAYTRQRSSLDNVGENELTVSWPWMRR